MQLLQINAFVAADYFGTSLMRKLLPQVIAGSASARQVGYLEACYGVGQVVGSICLPYLSDSRGRKVILQLSCFGTALGYGISATVVEYPEWVNVLLLGRGVTGLVKQTLTMARAIVGDVQVQGSAGSGMAILTSASSLGYLAGPEVGGRLADAVGVAVPIWLVTALFVCLGLLCRRLPETAPAMRRRDNQALPTDWSWMRQCSQLCALLAIAFGEMALTGWTSVVRPRVSKTILPGGYNSAGRYDIVLSLFVLLGCELWRRSKDWSTPFLMAASNVAFAAGLLLLWLFKFEWALYASAFPMGVGISAARTLPAALLNDLAPELQRGAAMGVIDFVGSICRVAAPLLTGYVIDFSSDDMGLVLLVGCLLLSAVVLISPWVRCVAGGTHRD